MKRDVVLSIQGRQRYGEQEPETIELVTGGTMEFRDGGWDITYEESELTGLAGVVTTFRVEPGKVTLNREGALICPLLHQLDQKGRLDWLVFTIACITTPQTERPIPTATAKINRGRRISQTTS